MLKDGHGRVVDYLRISVTQRCNFRCIYCMPEKPFSWVPKEDLLSYEEMFRFVKIAIDKGVNKIRITGGEPLLREDLHLFIQMIYDYKNDIDLCLTTNGYLVRQTAQLLKNSGLKRINISLDSLKKETTKKISQKDVLEEVLKGIKKATDVGLGVKINTVPLKDINDSEILDILEFCENLDIPVRFIEYMENSFASADIVGCKAEEILATISTRYNYKKLPRVGSSPAIYYELESGYQFGIIEPYEDDFCESCNRMRLTAEGLLIPCLYFEDALSIKQTVKDGDTDGTIAVLENVLLNKPEKNRWSKNKLEKQNETSSRAFYETGG